MALSVIATIPVGEGPVSVAVKPTGFRAYVANVSSDTVSVISTANHTTVATVAVGAGASPQSVVVHPDGTRVFVGCAAGTVSVIDTANNELVSEVDVWPRPWSLAINPGGSLLYAVCDSGEAVKVIDTGSMTVTETISVDQSPLHAAVSGNRLCVIHYKGGVSVIDTTTNSVVDSIPAPIAPHNIAVDGGLAYVTNQSGIGTVSVIDIAAKTVTATIPVGLHPHGIAVSGTQVYVANWGTDTVSVIDTATNTVTDTIPVGTAPVDVAVGQGGGRIYVPNSGDDTVTVIKYEGPKKLHPGLSDLPELVGKLVGGAAGDGGGWLVIGNHAYPIPPRPPALLAIARAAAPYLGSPIENREVGAQLRRMR